MVILIVLKYHLLGLGIEWKITIFIHSIEIIYICDIYYAIEKSGLFNYGVIMLSFSTPPKLRFLFSGQLISDLTGVCCTRFKCKCEIFP